MKKLLLLAIFLPLLAASQEGKKKLPRMVPDHVKLQYAGGMGFLSIGVGYESPNKKFQGDFYYGYVPAKWGGGKPIHSLTGKFTYLPLDVKLDENTRLDILNVGVLFNYSYGSQYFMFKPDNYPYGYYGFPTQMNASIFIGSALTRGKVGVYYEAGTGMKDILGYVKNSNSLAFVDMVYLGVGVRYAVK